MLLKFNSSRASHSVSYHGKRSVRNAKNVQVRIGSSRRTTPSPVHTRIAAVLYACVPVYARLRYEKLDRSNSSRRFPICTVVRLRSRSWCSHWTPSDRPVASRRSLRRVPSRPVECELGFTNSGLVSLSIGKQKFVDVVSYQLSQASAFIKDCRSHTYGFAKSWPPERVRVHAIFLTW